MPTKNENTEHATWLMLCMGIWVGCLMVQTQVSKYHPGSGFLMPQTWGCQSQVLTVGFSETVFWAFRLKHLGAKTKLDEKWTQAGNTHDERQLLMTGTIYRTVCMHLNKYIMYVCLYVCLYVCAVTATCFPRLTRDETTACWNPLYLLLF